MKFGLVGRDNVPSSSLGTLLTSSRSHSRAARVWSTSLPSNILLAKEKNGMEDHSAKLQAGGPCCPPKRRTVAPACPLLTPFTLGSFDLDIRMVYAPLTRCRAIGESLARQHDCRQY